MEKKREKGFFSSFTGLSKTAKLMMAATAVICAVLLGLGLLAINLIYRFTGFQIEGNMPYISGIALGGVQSVVKIFLIEKSMNMVLDMGEKNAKASGVGAMLYFGRFILTIAVLAFAFIFRGICGPVGTIAGVLSLQFAGYATGAILRKDEPQQIQGNQEEVEEDAEGEEEE